MSRVVVTLDRLSGSCEQRCLASQRHANGASEAIEVVKSHALAIKGLIDFVSIGQLQQGKPQKHEETGPRDKKRGQKKSVPRVWWSWGDLNPRP